jgi:GNAT superfamily N-acetyltransferase
MDCTIRSALQEDSAALVGLLGQLGYSATVDEVQQRLQAVDAHPTDAVRVATVEGSVVGLLSLHILLYFHEGILLGRVSALVVDAAHRGQGIGRYLMRDAEHLAWTHGCSKMEVASALPRTEAHAFYEKVGYERVAYRFVKSLAPGSKGE